MVDAQDLQLRSAALDEKIKLKLNLLKTLQEQVMYNEVNPPPPEADSTEALMKEIGNVRGDVRKLLSENAALKKQMTELNVTVVGIASDLKASNALVPDETILKLIPLAHMIINGRFDDIVVIKCTTNKDTNSALNILSFERLSESEFKDRNETIHALVMAKKSAYRIQSKTKKIAATVLEFGADNVCFALPLDYGVFLAAQSKEGPEDLDFKLIFDSIDAQISTINGLSITGTADISVTSLSLAD